MSAHRNWTRDEHLLAFNVYCRLPFGKLHTGTPEIQVLAELVGRSVNSAAMKLNNFARLDPALKERGIKGLSRGAKGEEQIWNEFADEPERLAFESERILASRTRPNADRSSLLEVEETDAAGEDREVWVRTRVNQAFFRRRVLAAFDFRCCVTGIDVPGLLVASHIIPWAANSQHRLDSRNGLCLNPFHDRAFDRGWMWIDEEFRIQFSPSLIDDSQSFERVDWIAEFQGKELLLPSAFSPSEEFLDWHRKNVVGQR